MKSPQTVSTAIGVAALLGRVATAYTVNSQGVNSLPACAAPPKDGPVYDYIIVGSGAGGGPLAASLAIKGFEVLVVDAGHDVVNFNTTIPMYFGKSNDDPELSLDYYVSLYGPSSNVAAKESFTKDWYPRAAALGGSTIHNAQINVLQMKWDFDNIASITNISTWKADNMYNYFKAIENNRYIARNSSTGPSHGYDGWLYTDEPGSYLMGDPKYHDDQLLGVFGALEESGPILPGVDINALQSENKVGNGVFPLTTSPNHTRSSIRNHLFTTRAKHPNSLKFQLDTLATKILLCKSGTGTNASAVAYGVEVAPGANLLPVARLHSGKSQLNTTKLYARYETIISTGVFQTPQLLQLSGLGPSSLMNNFGLSTIVDLPGVGENLQDRLEMSVLYDMKEDFKLYQNCTFSNTPVNDPCLQEWVTGDHENLYSAGAAIWINVNKTSPGVPYNDLWTMFIPGAFRGYYPGYGVALGALKNVMGAAILKGHAAAKGWVRITGNNPQDSLLINKNLYASPDSIADRTAIREAVKNVRQLFTSTANMSVHINHEYFPGANVTTDAQIDSFINVNGWGHHACCTAKIGVETDSAAVVNGDFQVHGVSNLRIVDNSVWPVIPGLFVTTPIYMISEKAADVISAYADTKGWKPTP